MIAHVLSDVDPSSFISANGVLFSVAATSLGLLQLSSETLLSAIHARLSLIISSFK